MAQQETLKTAAQRARAMERMIRVNQAGEFGAKRIYAGQLAVMGDRTPCGAQHRAYGRTRGTPFKCL